ncbi:hypothetical protein BV22DRAFT_1032237 [Leucogyrophana mollusca]|uniref:Uncharacterized protein n=1 Tax=Leucogyrophana mollusca TaxID=85980 RepID=A0ACB8BN61_9AGAM|nr:hypothetical protein BV22DRAFT_1032237 [Leucogyrophana mollusca]
MVRWAFGLDTPSQPRISPELWLAIFEHVPPRHIHDVTLTCQAFRQLAQPFLFRSLNFCPYSLDAQGRRYLSRPDALERMEHRLRFCASDRIRHAVHECRFYPRYIVGMVRHGDESSADTMLNTILCVLPCFINLRTLAFLFVDLNPLQLAQLCKMHPLDTLLLGNCSTALVSNAPSLLKASRVQVVSDKNPTSIPRQLSLSVLDPHHLQSVAFINVHAVGHFLEEVVALNVLPSLRCLSIPSSAPLLRDLVALLHNLPALQELTLTKTAHSWSLTCDFGTIPTPNFVNSLSRFHGPYQLVSKFVQGRTLRELSIWNGRPSDEEWFMRPAQVQSTLCNSREAIRSVEVVELSVTYLEETVLATVCSLFPRLRSLHVDVSQGLHVHASVVSYTLEALMENLIGSKFPSTIEKLRISSRARGHQLSQQEMNKYTLYQHRLVESFPGLSFVSVDDTDLNMSWLSP